MTILEHISLKNYTTFGIEATARHFVEITSPDELPELLKKIGRDEFLILGGGSNILLTHDFEGIAIKISILGKKIVHETDETVAITIGAGENWHTFVEWCVQHNYAGVENLALIPGTVGAAPIQNIGAYGVEINDVFQSLEWFDIDEASSRTFLREECKFGYRDSIFKRELKGRGIITSVTVELHKSTIALHTNYKDVQQELGESTKSPTIHDVFSAVCAVRTRKLPNPEEVGNAGSFFKNPIIASEHYITLLNSYPQMPCYPQSGENVKIPAAWLIEQCGWKGVRRGAAGVYPRQALVLVNYGGALGEEILALSREIQASVFTKFGITIEPEVNIL
jgi:UDP-N-acetylmuramate dehydrogenase